MNRRYIPSEYTLSLVSTLFNDKKLGQWDEIHTLSTLRHKFINQKKNATANNVDWSLDFNDYCWLMLKEKNGKIPLMNLGRGKDDFCLMRKDTDKGFSQENVMITTFGQKAMLTANLGRKIQSVLKCTNVKTNEVVILKENRQEWASKHDLSMSALLRVAKGEFHQHKGWKCEFVD